MILWQQWLILRISARKGHLLRLPVPGFPFSVSMYLIRLLQLTTFTNLFLSPSSLFDNTHGAIIEGRKRRKRTKQGCSFTYVNEGHSKGRIFWCFSSFKSTDLNLIMLRDLQCIKFCRVCFTISSWQLEGINNINFRYNYFLKLRQSMQITNA